jgi:hypothetical protein
MLGAAVVFHVGSRTAVLTIRAISINVAIRGEENAEVIVFSDDARIALVDDLSKGSHGASSICQFALEAVNYDWWIQV